MQSPPTIRPPAKEEKSSPTPDAYTRVRAGQTPMALAVKAVLRPIFKGIYYLLKVIGAHKLLTLGLIALLLISIFVTNFIATGSLPFGIASDPFNNFSLNGRGGGEQVKNWLYALRDSNTTQMNLLQSGIANPPDAKQLASTYSTPQTHMQWKDITVVGTHSLSDSTEDSFVSVDLVSHGPGGDTKAVVMFHFVTLPQQNGRILGIDFITARKYLQ